MLLKNCLRCIFFCLLLIPVPMAAQGWFVENKGQWPANVLFATDVEGGKLFITKTGLVFNFFDLQTLEAIHAAHHGETALPRDHLPMHAYSITFDGATAFQARGMHPSVTSYNYFIGPAERHASGARGYAMVLLENIYPRVDMQLYHSASGLKYDLIVKPGGDPNAIAFAYAGVNPRAKAGKLTINTSVNQIVEQPPVSWQISGRDSLPVNSSYHLSKNTLRFNTGDYDHSKTLIIDPELIFSSYSGSTANNFGYTATYDEQGNLYGGGSVFSAGYPTTIGAYDGSYAGGTDIGISKFSTDGTTMLYSTYLGGISAELPHSIIVNDNNELFVLGTTSSPDYPVSAGAFQPTFTGATSAPIFHVGLGATYQNGSDLVVSRLSASGEALLASTFVGGSDNDGLNTATALAKNYADEVRGEIELDPSGNVVIGTCTFSADFPVTADAPQATNGGGLDGIVFKMDPALQSLLWSSYFGGSGADAIYSIVLEGDTAIVAAGGTTSPNLNFPAQAWQGTHAGGGTDGFLAGLSLTSNNVFSGTYFGSDKYDQLYFVDSDENQNLYVFGQTKATSTFFIQNALFGQANSGMLLAKFNPELSQRIWSTVFGDGSAVPNLSPSAFAVDICNKIYLSGWGGAVNDQGSTNGLPITPDAYQSTTDGSDFYLMVLEEDASAVAYATYFGGPVSPEHVDGGTSRFDKSGKMYQAVCAGCQGNDDFPIYPADVAGPHNNSLCNLGVFKFDLDLPLIFANFEADAICLPAPVSFQNTSETFTGANPVYLWQFGDGATTADPNPSHLYSEPGTYTVSLIIADPQACNLADTISKSITVLPALQVALADSVFSCSANTFELSANTNGSATMFTWASDADFTNILAQGATDSLLSYTAVAPGFIYIKIENDICTLTDSIFVSPPPTWNLSYADTTLCAKGPLTISLSADQPVTNITWNTPATILSGQNTNELTIFVESNTNIAVEAQSLFGCPINGSAEIAVYPVSLHVAGDTLTCTADPVVLSATINPEATGIVWSASADFATPLSTDTILQVVPDSSQYYYVQASNGSCALIDSVLVSLFTASTSITPDQLICFGDSARISVYNDFPVTTLTHTWQPQEYITSGNGTSQIWVQVDETTTFTATSENEAGCTTENSSTVFVSSLGSDSVFIMAYPVPVLQGDSVQLLAVPADAYDYIWEPTEPLSNPNIVNPIAVPDSTTYFTVTIYDQQPTGICAKTAGILIEVYDFICAPPVIYLPNAFTPNGDGINDVLYLRGRNLTDMQLQIFNRWGEIVFETEKQDMGWDGSYRGEPCSPAVYVYQLRATCADGQEYFGKGNITLIR